MEQNIYEWSFIMRNFTKISFFAIVLISVLIGAMNRISFYTFLKRAIIFYLFILGGLYLFTSSVKTAKPTKKNLQESDDKSSIEIDADDFIPMDFRDIEKIYSNNNTNYTKS